MSKPQSDECTPEVAWQVEWISPVAGQLMVQRRDQFDAMMLAKHLSEKGGLRTKLYRVEKTEIDF